MAVPKRRSSKQRKNKRRSANWKISAPGLVECPQCHSRKLSHRVCGTCGYYNGRQVIDTEKKQPVPFTPMLRQIHKGCAVQFYYNKFAR